FSENQRRQHFFPVLHALQQQPLVEGKQSLLRVDPKIAQPVVLNVTHHMVRQSLVRADAVEMVMVEKANAAVQSANPVASFLIECLAKNELARQTVRHVKCFEFAVANAPKSAALRSHPHVAFRTDLDGSYIRRRRATEMSQPFQFAVAITNQAQLRADP